MDIPIEYQKGISTFITMKEIEFLKLLDILEAQSPLLDIKKLTKSILDTLEHEEFGELNNVIAVLDSFYEFRAAMDFNTDDAIEKIIGSSLGEESLFDLVDKNIDVFRRRLLIVLESENSLSLIYKMLDVTRDHEHLFLESRILTDIRTVFKSKIAEPIGAAIIQILKIEYRESNQKKEFFVALEPQDIEQLLKQLDRAQEKAKSLRLILKNAKVDSLDEQ